MSARVKRALKVLLAVFGIFVVLIGGPVTFCVYMNGAFLRPRDVRVNNPALAVQDARELIGRFGPSVAAEKKVKRLRPEELPQSLRIPWLRSAQVCPDHINLILGHNPDWTIGARIWSADATTKHADKPTAYRDIYFFDYTNDLPVSPDNQL